MLEILQAAWEQAQDHHPCGLQWAQLAGAFSLKGEAFWEACFQLEAVCHTGLVLGRWEGKEVCWWVLETWEERVVGYWALAMQD